MIYAVSEVGDMVDFLKAYPALTIDDYLWKLSVPLIRLMRFDNTHLEHLSDKEIERRKREDTGLHLGGEHGFNAINDLGQQMIF